MQKEEKIKLSVIINTQNSENTICETLESIKDVDEIIIIDEHSKDDTIEIAKEYKAKIIYSNKNELNIAFNQALEECSNDWIFVLKDREIVSLKLLNEINRYIENPKKNTFLMTLPKKNFYFEKEIKFLKNKSSLRVFKKGFAQLKNNFSLELKKKAGKIFKFNKNFKILNAYIYNHLENDISEEIEKLIENNRYELKKMEKLKSSCFIKPLKKFVSLYFLKGGMFEKYGLILSLKYAYFEFLKQTMMYEKKLRGIENDI